jgi:hypothetical protein
VEVSLVVVTREIAVMRIGSTLRKVTESRILYLLQLQEISCYFYRLMMVGCYLNSNGVPAGMKVEGEAGVMS